MRATARATIAPSELPTTTAGRRFLTSQNAMEVIALKSSLSNDGMFRSGATNAEAFRLEPFAQRRHLPPLRRGRETMEIQDVLQAGTPPFPPIKTRSERLVNSPAISE